MRRIRVFTVGTTVIKSCVVTAMFAATVFAMSVSASANALSVEQLDPRNYSQYRPLAEEGKAAVCKGWSDARGEVVINRFVTFDGLDGEFEVVQIDAEAFAGCADITKITLPESITDIGYYAFYGTSLESVTLPPLRLETENKSYDEIKYSSFAGISTLKDVYTHEQAEWLPLLHRQHIFNMIDFGSFRNMPDSDWEYLNSELLMPFYGSSENATLHAPKQALDYLMMGFMKFKSYDATDGDLRSDSGDKRWCEYTNVDTEALNPALYSRYRPLGDGKAAVCKGWDDAQGDVFIDAKVSIPGYGVCDVVRVDRGVFYGNTNLTYIKLPNSITYIDDYAFYGTSLRDVILPEQLKHIGINAFGNITTLRDVYAYKCGDVLPTMEDKEYKGLRDPDGEFYMPEAEWHYYNASLPTPFYGSCENATLSLVSKFDGADSIPMSYAAFKYYVCHSDITDIEHDSAPEYSIDGKSITTHGDITVYDIDGRMCHNGVGTVTLPAGIYIVKGTNGTAKVAMR